nr:mitochondrial arginine transporter BAC1 [Ipomoea batatas]
MMFRRHVDQGFDKLRAQTVTVKTNSGVGEGSSKFPEIVVDAGQPCRSDDPNHSVAHGARKDNVWRSVFNPGSNLATKNIGAQVKLQKHNTSADGIKYKNGLHCAARILKAEGVKGLYRGATSSFVGMAFESSLAFGIYSQTKRFLQINLFPLLLKGGLEGGKPQPHVIIPSAALAGSIISFILCPSELVKCRIQVQGTDSLLLSSTRYSGPLDCAIKTVKTGGYWSAVLPLDVAKTIIQTSPDKNHTRNPFQILQKIYRLSGLRGCYTGLGPTLVRAFPANAAAIVTWELSAKILGIKRD